MRVVLPPTDSMSAGRPATRRGHSPRLTMRRVAMRSACLCLLILAGCANFWDDVTSQDFKLSQWWQKPNPYVVLRDSTDGDQRARALRALREPKTHGGTDKDQDTVVKILVSAATGEKQFLCRVAAVECLGQFQDPRAVNGLIDAFYKSGSFSAELSTRLQCQAVQSLGNTHNPAAISFLVTVVKGAPAEGTEQEKQQVMDVRIAAAHALGNFNKYAAAQALVQVLQKERDVALCDASFESLQLCSGKKLPSDYKNWDEVLAEARAREADPNHGRSAINLAGWFR
jgi:HEAT repeat protein